VDERVSDQPWLSVITVVKDAVSDLERTLASLQDQLLDGVEYLVIDSSSEQAEIPAALAARQIPHRYVWQPAAGIYAAMNEGLKQARGTYVYFLNAGDELLPGALAQVAAISDHGKASWVIGRVDIVSVSGAVVTTPAWNYADEQRACFARGLFAPHQGTFARADDLRAVGGFDSDYRIAADYAAFLALTRLSSPVMLNSAVARFHEGGLSTQRWQDSFREFHRARKQLLKPTGKTAVLERLHTARQFFAVGVYRGIWSKIVKP